MTVKQLMKKLEKLPQDAVVTIPNDSLYVDGAYEVSGVEVWDYDDSVEVYIFTDYKKRVEV